MPEERRKNEKLDVDVGDYEIEVPGGIPHHKTTTQSHNIQSIYRQAKQDEGGRTRILWQVKTMFSHGANQV